MDDRWHPGEIPRRGLEGLGDFEWIEDGLAWSLDSLFRHRLAVLAKANQRKAADTTPWVDDRVGDSFQDWVQQGGGFLVIHSGTSGYENIPSMRGLSAGAFASHPEQCPVTVEPVAGHPLCEGIESFTETDEHYVMHFDDASADVFLRSRSAHGVQPAGWRRTVGKGRVCVLTPGHRIEVWLRPEFRELLRRCLLWCGGEA
ncbi:type 1 glutamine amidotransferase [Haloferula luteola]|uniref:Type 1 glutamine amidotransferase n=1 Tax=Haloferula luteola TaxID=595692 RepID=A0A840VD53_9BACT|nr:type 1 glutamine amidotransferase [Haloferula luteola]